MVNVGKNRGGTTLLSNEDIAETLDFEVDNTLTCTRLSISDHWHISVIFHC